MLRKPRKVNDKIVSRAEFFRMIFTAVVMTIGTLIVFESFDPSNNLILAQTMAFTTIVFFQLFQALNCRSVDKSLFKVGVFRNKFLWGAIFISILLQCLILYSPLNALFGVVPLGIYEWSIVLLVSSSIFVLREVWKAVEGMRS